MDEPIAAERRFDFELLGSLVMKKLVFFVNIIVENKHTLPIMILFILI
jgi:hypothetical protein